MPKALLLLAVIFMAGCSHEDRAQTSEDAKKLGQDIKRRSPFRYTYVFELANDYIGYIPDRHAFELGGYQTWTGLHSFLEPGTGELIVAESIKLLDRLHNAQLPADAR